MVVPVEIPAAENTTDTKLAEQWKQKEMHGKHIKYSGILLIIAGVLGIIQSAYSYLNSHKWAKFIVEHKKLPWGCHKGHHMAEHRKPEPINPEEPNFMTRDEFLLIDLFKNIGIISFMLFCAILFAGMASKRVARFKDSRCLNWVVRKIITMFIMFVFFYFMSKKLGGEFMEIFMRIADEETKTMMAEKHKHKIGMCPIMIVFFIVKLFNLYKLKCFQHTFEKIDLLESHKKEQEKKDKIIQAVQQMQQ